MQYSFIRNPLALALITLTLAIAHKAQANNEYQYFVGGSGTYYDYGNKSKGERFNLYLGGYFSPVSLEGNTPYAETAYWQRKSSISLSGWKSHHDGFNLVTGAAIWMGTNQSGEGLSLHLSKIDLPVWLKYHLVYHNDAKFNYRGGTQYYTSTTEAHDVHEILIGLYVADTISLYTGYYENSGHKTYEVGADSLFTLSNGLSVGVDSWYAYTKGRRPQTSIVNGNVFNLDFAENNSDQFSITGKLYPTKDLGLYLGYYHQRRVEYENNAYTASINYFVTPAASINFSVRSRNNSDYFHAYYWPEYTSTSVGLGYRF